MMGQEVSDFRVRQTKEGGKELFLNGKYVLTVDSPYYQVIQFLVLMINEKNTQSHGVFPRELRIAFHSSLEFVLGKCRMEEEKCTICMEEFVIGNIEKELAEKSDEDVYALACSHKYHQACLASMIAGKKWVKCPVCSSIFGVMVGDQPEGTISVHFDKHMKCQGYPPGTIVVHYSMKAGVKGANHYPSTSRTGYLPDTLEGREVCELLREAFARKLTFTVGRSVTTGLDNQIVWNGIHHKTSLGGGAAHFGYPDPTYLKRVKEELALKGIVPK